MNVVSMTTTPYQAPGMILNHLLWGIWVLTDTSDPESQIVKTRPDSEGSAFPDGAPIPEGALIPEVALIPEGATIVEGKHIPEGAPFHEGSLAPVGVLHRRGKAHIPNLR